MESAKLWSGKTQCKTLQYYQHEAHEMTFIQLAGVGEAGLERRCVIMHIVMQILPDVILVCQITQTCDLHI